MTDFWLNHFNVYVRKSQQEPYLLGAYERDTIRPNALGNFETLLVATAKSPAMEVYLDNFRSVGPDSQAAGKDQAGAGAEPEWQADPEGFSRAERELRPRVDGAAHARREWRLHAGGCDKRIEGVYRMGAGSSLPATAAARDGAPWRWPAGWLRSVAAPEARESLSSTRLGMSRGRRWCWGR